MPGIAFYVSHIVVAVKTRNVYILFVKLRHKPLEQIFIPIQLNSGFRQFLNGKRQQLQDSGASSQRLGDLRFQGRLMTAGKDVLPLGAAFIAFNLDIAQKHRKPLDFVNDDRSGITLQKFFGIAFR